jgi:DNA-binding response OmpR family regulator
MSLPTLGTLNILVVEDDEAVAELLREVLNDVPGWGATVVHDAAAARAVFHDVQVEILVLDLNLPGVSGLELLELLRRDAEWRDPPVIMISAAPSQPGVHEALARGALLRIIAKPFDLDQLIESVRVAAAEYLDPRASVST